MTLYFQRGLISNPSGLRIYEESERKLTRDDCRALERAERVLEKLPSYSIVYATKDYVIAIAAGHKTAPEAYMEARKDLEAAYRTWGENGGDIIAAINFSVTEVSYMNMAADGVDVLYSSVPAAEGHLKSYFLSGFLGIPTHLLGIPYLKQRVYIETQSGLNNAKSRTAK